MVVPVAPWERTYPLLSFPSLRFEWDMSLFLLPCPFQVVSVAIWNRTCSLVLCFLHAIFPSTVRTFSHAFSSPESSSRVTSRFQGDGEMQHVVHKSCSFYSHVPDRHALSKYSLLRHTPASDVQIGCKERRPVPRRLTRKKRRGKGTALGSMHAKRTSTWLQGERKCRRFAKEARRLASLPC